MRPVRNALVVLFAVTFFTAAAAGAFGAFINETAPTIGVLELRWGIDSISVTADVVDQTRRNVAAAEQRVLLDAARGGRPAVAARRGAAPAVLPATATVAPAPVVASADGATRGDPAAGLAPVA
jgi:hypothetical protein